MSRVEREIEHGKFLASEGAEISWGWGTPAGKERAKRRGALIAATAGLNGDSRALEIGCGTGIFTEILARTGAGIVAVDISTELLDMARSRNLPSDQVVLLEKRFEDCDVDGPFDAVVGSSVLHHLDLVPALRKMAELLKPGGVMAFAEPNFLNPQIFIERKFRRAFAQVSPDETAFVRWSLEKELGRAGFEGMKITPFDWLHPFTPRILINSVKAMGCCLEKIPLVREFAGSLLISAKKNMV